MVSEAEEVVIGFGSGRIFVVMAGHVLAMLRNLVMEAVVVTEANLGPGNHLVPGPGIADEDPQWKEIAVHEACGVRAN